MVSVTNCYVRIQIINVKRITRHGLEKYFHCVYTQKLCYELSPLWVI